MLYLRNVFNKQTYTLKLVSDPLYSFNCSSAKRNKSLDCDSNKAKKENAPFRGFLNAWQFVNFVNVVLFARIVWV